MCIGFLNFYNFKKGEYASLCKFSTCLLRQYDMMKMDSTGVFSGKRCWRNTSCSNSMFLLQISAQSFLRKPSGIYTAFMRVVHFGGS